MQERIDRGRVGRLTWLVTWLVGGLAASALVGGSLVFLLPAAAAAETLPVLFSIAAVGAGVGAFYQNVVLRRRAEKVSGEMDALSARLLRLEARLAEPDRAATGLTSTVAEVTGEIALLGGIVRDLAVTVATQDRDVATLKDQVERSKAQAVAQPPLAAKAPPPAAVPAPDREQRARERAIIPSILPMPEPQDAANQPAASQRFSAQPAAREERPAPDRGEIRRVKAVLEAFDSDRIELHLQPVVSLPQRKARFYEVLARLRLADDTILVPAEFLPTLEKSGLVADFDRKVLTRAAGIARHLAGRGSDARVSCNLSPASLEGGVLRAAGRIAEAYPDIADRLMLELSQHCWRTLDADTAGTIALLRGKGFAFALDRATDLRFDPLALAERGVAFVKLPAELLLRPEMGRGLDIAVGDLGTVLTRAGIRLVAERVEREEDVPNLIDLDVPLAQGFVFAPPRAIRPEVLAPSGAATAAAPEPQPAPVAAEPLPAAVPSASFEERRPFRTFLRRAG
jgi:cyclic-di-GMP phosphodiesterase, flagellum assembly factor TipF